MKRATLLALLEAAMASLQAIYTMVSDEGACEHPEESRKPLTMGGRDWQCELCDHIGTTEGDDGDDGDADPQEP